MGTIVDHGLYTYKAAAEILEVDRSTISRWVLSGKISAEHSAAKHRNFIRGSELKRVENLTNSLK